MKAIGQDKNENRSFTGEGYMNLKYINAHILVKLRFKKHSILAAYKEMAQDNNNLTYRQKSLQKGHLFNKFRDYLIFFNIEIAPYAS